MADDPYAPTTTASAGPDGTAPGKPLTDFADTFGHYRLLKKIGEGGMGAVYEAQQDKPRRTVALKVVRPGYLSATLLRRFDLESQALARLQHPGIAQVYEAGTVELSGGGTQPFFAMELIRGAPLTEHAATKALDRDARLHLIVRICEAVQHAHQRGVIHRDLKPANILVDETGQPKILDFGIARLTESDIQATTMQTDPGQIIGTLPYMSPEQAAGDPGDLDTRADVYALGVIAYELLAGRLPHDLKGKPLHEALRTIREEEPATLSTAGRTLRGDVETIVSKALEKDKTRRYQSAGDLGADIERYLQHKPITARPATTLYQLRKFARRHRALVTGVAAAFVALVVGLAATVWQAVAARRALAETSARETLLARQRGQWKQVIAAADQAESIGLTDPWPVRLLRLEAVANLNPAHVDAELGRLDSRHGAARHGAALELWRAEPRFSKAGAPDQIAQRARHALGLGLEGADEAYAKAILAPRIPEGIVELERAVKLDPFHSRANQLLITYYSYAGRYGDAERRTRAWLLAEPENAAANLHLVAFLNTSSRFDESEALLDSIEALIDPDVMKRQRQSLQWFRDLGGYGEVLAHLEPWRMGDIYKMMGASFASAATSYESGGSESPGMLTGQGATPAMARVNALQLRSSAGAILSGGKLGLDTVKELYTLCPSLPNAHSYATALLKAGKFREASDLCEQYIGTKERDPLAGREFDRIAMIAANSWFMSEHNPETLRIARERALRWVRRIVTTGTMDPFMAASVALVGATMDQEWLIRTAVADLHTFEHVRPIDYKRASAFFTVAGTPPMELLFLAQHGVIHNPDNPELRALRDQALERAQKRAAKAKGDSMYPKVLEALGLAAPQLSPTP